MSAMRRRFPVVLALVSAVAAAAAQVPSPAPPVRTLIKAGRMVDVRTGAYRVNQALLIVGERIDQVGPVADRSTDVSR